MLAFTHTLGDFSVNSAVSTGSTPPNPPNTGAPPPPPMPMLFATAVLSSNAQQVVSPPPQPIPGIMATPTPGAIVGLSPNAKTALIVLGIVGGVLILKRFW